MVFRHFFGVNTEIKGGLFLTDEDKHLIYPAGHNVVMYKVDDKEQFFMMGTLHLYFGNKVLLLGSEKTEAITHVSISEGGTYVCVCERSTDGYKGQFSIFKVIS